MAFTKALVAAAAALSFVQVTSAWNIELPPCLDPFKPYVYSGCYQNTSPDQLVYRSSQSSANMTVENCVSECKGNGFRYAGLAYYGVCFCGPSVIGAALDEAQCSFPCNGDKSQKCGGNNIVSVYQDPTFSAETDEVTVDNYVPLGCYTDQGPAGRSLSWPQRLDADTFTTDSCLSACKRGGFPFAGTEYGRECYCGSVLANHTVPALASECNIPCRGDTSETCGGRSRLNIYVAKELESLEPCGHQPPNPSSSTTASVPVITTSAVPGTTSVPAITTSAAPGTTSVPEVDTTSVPNPDTTSAPHSPDTSSAPSNPDTSSASSPDTTSVPSNPDTSSAPSNPDTTSASSSPDTSSVPSNPDTTSVPSVPITTSVPSVPITTSVPSIPSTTAIPPIPSTTSVPSIPSVSSVPAIPGPSSSSSSSSIVTTRPPVTTTTRVIPSTTTASVCTTTTTPPRDCEYKCGKWCLPSLPEFDDDESCLGAWKTCAKQVTSCFKYAGFPGALECLEFSTWCNNVQSYCKSDDCKNSWGKRTLKKCNKKTCFDKYRPKNPTPPKAPITSVVPCLPATTIVTSTAVPTTTVPEPTNICKQPSNSNLGYGPGKPVGGIQLPLVTCNDIKHDFFQNPFKLYTEQDSRRCRSYTRPKCTNACADACEEQYEECKATYVESCRPEHEGKWWWKRDESDKVDRRTLSLLSNLFGGLFGNNGNRDTPSRATEKCTSQYKACLAVNKYVNADNRCKAWGSGL